LYAEYGTAIELDGRLAHPGDTRWSDIRRDNAAAAIGVTTLRYGWKEVTTTPCVVAAEVARVLVGRGYTGARPCSADCPVGRHEASAQQTTPRSHEQATATRRVPARPVKRARSRTPRATSRAPDRGRPLHSFLDSPAEPSC
jgi:hypothetical protein